MDRGLDPLAVDVWRVRVSGSVPADWRRFLNPPELARADRFRVAADRDRFTVARGVLKRLLQERRKGTGPLEFVVNQWGKPAVSDGEPRFNVSHSGDYVLIAIASGAEVGVDIEHMAAPRRLDELARSVFAAREFEMFGQLQGAERDRFFFRIWTCKEAVVKAAGAGLGIPLDRVEIELGGCGMARIHTEPQVLPQTPWSLHEIAVGEEYAAAAAVRANLVRLEIHDWTANG